MVNVGFHWKEDFSSPEEAILGLVVFFVSPLCLISIIIHFIYSKYHTKEFNQVHQHLRWLALSCTVCNLIYAIGNLSVEVMAVFFGYFNCTLSTWPIVFVGFGRLSLYLFFIFRLHYSFTDTLYDVSIYKLKLISILMIFTVVSALLIHYYNIISNNCSESSYIFGGAIATLQDTFWITTMFTWFCIKLNKILKTINLGLNNNNNSNSNKNNNINNNNNNSINVKSNTTLVNNNSSEHTSNSIYRIPSKTPQLQLGNEIEIISDENYNINTSTLTPNSSSYNSDSNASADIIDIPDTINENENENENVNKDRLKTMTNEKSNTKNGNINSNINISETNKIEKRKTENDILFLKTTIKLCVLSFVAMFTTWIAVISFAFVDASIGTSIDIVFNS